MTRANKILIPLGLCISILVPVVVKTLVTDLDIFSASEGSEYDYLQPYRLAPEGALELPGKVASGERALPQAQKNNTPGSSSRTGQAKSYLNLDKSIGIDPEVKKLSNNSELELILEASSIRENLE